MEESAVLFNIIHLLKHAFSSFCKCRCQEILINDDNQQSKEEKKQKKEKSHNLERNDQNPETQQLKGKKGGKRVPLLVSMSQNLTEDQKLKS